MAIADLQNPKVSQDYATLLQSIRELFDSFAKLHDGTGITNTPNGMVRWASANNRFEKFNGSTWALLSSLFSFNQIACAGSATFSDATAPIISAKIGPTNTQQHAIPAVASDTLALVGAAQTLTNKTFTSPTINGGAYSGSFSGNKTYTGQISFTHGTAPVISAKIGPNSGQQHNIPAVSSDTFLLRDAAQSVNNKSIGASTVDNTPIGSTTPSTGKFTTVDSSGAIKENGNQVLNSANWSSYINSLPVGFVGFTASPRLPAGFLKRNGAAVSRTTYAALFAELTIQSTGNTQLGSGVIAGVSAANQTGMQVGMPISGPGIPAGATITALNPGTGSLTISAACTATASVTIVVAPWGVGDGSTTFNLPEGRGRFDRGMDDGAGVDSGRVLGTLQGSTIGSHSHSFQFDITDGGNGNVLRLGFDIYGSTSGAILSAGSSETRPVNGAYYAVIKY